MRIVVELVRDTPFAEMMQDVLPKIHVKISITKVTMNNLGFEFWIEYSAPKGNGVVIGTIVMQILTNADVEVKEIYGTHFVPKTSNHI